MSRPRTPLALATTVALASLLLGPRAAAQPEPEKPAAPKPEAEGDEPRPEPKPEEGPAAEPRPKVEAKPAAAEAGKAGAGAQPGAAPKEAEKGDRPLRAAIHLDIGPVKLIPVLLVQAQVLPYVGDDAYASQGDYADSEGFRLRRARFGLEVGLLDQGRGRVSVELGSREDGAARIHDAWLAWVGLPFLQIQGGAMTVPFSRSAIAGSADQALSERPLAVRSLAPGQQVGATAHGEIAKRAFVYDAGVFNGFSRSDQFFAGYQQNYAPLGNRFEGLAFVARAATEPLGPLTPSIADETKQAPALGLGADVFYSDGSARGILAAGGDALLHAAGFHLLAEGMFSQVMPKSVPEEPVAAVADVKSLGVVGEAGYTILKDLLGISVRFEYVDAAMGVDDEGDQWLLGGGASALFLDGMVKSTVEFGHREEIHGLSLANDALLVQAQLALP